MSTHDTDPTHVNEKRPRMTRRISPALAALLAMTLGGAGVLMAPAASADPAPPYTDANWDPYLAAAANQCTVTQAPFDGNPTDIATDGRPHAVDLSASATSVKIGDAADKTTTTFSEHLLGSIGTRGASPSAITLQFSGKVTSVREKTPSQCTPTGMLGSALNFAFTTTKPMWIDLRVLNRGNSYAEAYLWDADDSSVHYLEFYGKAMNFAGSQRTYLPAGNWAGYLEGDINLGPAYGPTGSGSLNMTFTDVGARTAGPSGRATPYVGFPATRTCATHNATLKLTSDRKRAKTIKKAVVDVNGHRVSTLRSGFRGRAIPLTLADDKAAAVKVTVTTVQTRHGKKIRKVRSVSANYLACN